MPLIVLGIIPTVMGFIIGSVFLTSLGTVVIGAGSVVVRDIPDNSIALGDPCRVIKKIDL